MFATVVLNNLCVDVDFCLVYLSKFYT
jgi:hypothetical protein